MLDINPVRSQIKYVEELLHRKLSPNEVIYYLDGNYKNTALTNLILLTNANRDKLDYFIDCQKYILCWPSSLGKKHWHNLRMLLIVLWTIRNNINFIKVWEIKQKKVSPMNKAKIKVNCLFCNKTFVPERITNKFCSLDCSHKYVSKFIVTKEELQALVWKMSIVNLAKKFKVSESAIDKRIRRLGVDRPPNGYWRRKSNKILKNM